MQACLASAATPENTAWLPKPWRNKLNTATPAATSSLSANQRRRTHDDVIDAIVEVDVLVIGSGAGGGVTASVLAEAGLRVLVVEKGAYMHPEDIPRADDEALLAAYEHGLLTSTSDSGAHHLWPPVYMHACMHASDFFLLGYTKMQSLCEYCILASYDS